MPDPRENCLEFEDRLLENRTLDPLPESLQGHLDECPSCRRQFGAHALLTAAFEGETVPALSATFDTRLTTAVGVAEVRIERLRGWRLSAMAAYITLAGGATAWLLRDVALTLDPGSAWTALLVALLVPPSFALALALSRLLPARPGGGSGAGPAMLLGL